MDRDRLNSAGPDYRPLLRAIVEENVAEPVEGGEGIEDFAICGLPYKNGETVR